MRARIVLAALLAATAHAATDTPVRVTADFNLRYEVHDIDTPGVFEQERLRLTAHVAAAWTPAPWATLRVGARTGQLDNQHSPTITLRTLDPYHGLGRRDVYLDVWQVVLRHDTTTATLGRMEYPFWSAGEVLWDGDVNPAGVFAAHTLGDGTRLAAAAFALPDGALGFTGHAAVAAVERTFANDGHPLRLAFTGLRVWGDGPARYAAARANELDYAIVQASAQLALSTGDTPASVGLDLFHNLETYGADTPAWAAALRDDRTGGAAYLSVGRSAEPGDVRFRYAFAWKGGLAVIPSASEDTLSRLGTSNYLAHDVRVTFVVLENLTVTPRLSLSRRVQGEGDAFRFRIDTNLGF